MAIYKLYKLKECCKGRKKIKQLLSAVFIEFQRPHVPMFTLLYVIMCCKKEMGQVRSALTIAESPEVVFNPHTPIIEN